MAFNKITHFNVDFKKNDIEVLDSDLIKTAAVKLPEGFTYDPDYLYLRVKAVSAGEYWGDNKNNDYFPEVELLNNYRTFLTAHTFKNHENKKIENAIGDVLSAEWSDKMKCVYLIIRIDKRIAPSVVRGYEKGFMTDVSMGCRVDHVVCSYCGKSAKTRFDYCDHLKTMKGRVMDNGKKVFEINIGPKFHDISTVLNGAERTAKTEGIYVNNGKVAFVENDTLEKTASFNGNPTSYSMLSMLNSNNLDKKASEEINMEVIASSIKDQKESKKEKPEDVAVAKKKIQEKVVNNALDEVTKDALKSVNEISDVIRYSYTKYMDKNKCVEIGKKLKDIAKRNNMSIDSVIKQFLDVADYAQIVLSPLELQYILFEAMDFDTIDLKNLNISSDKDNISNLDVLSENIAPNNNVGGILRITRSVSDGIANNDNEIINSLTSNPGTKLKIVISRSPKIDFSGADAQYDIMDNIIKDMLEERSFHQKYLLPRLSRMENEQPIDNSIQFSPIKMIRLKKVSPGIIPAVIPSILSSILYAANQRERVDRFNSGELNDGVVKFASELLDTNVYSDNIEKVAFLGIGNKKIISPRKAVLGSIPLTFAYSALQRSRMNNGDDVSSLNRYVAENPSNAAMMISLISGGTAKAINKKVPQVKGTVKDLKGKLVKSASENDDMFKNNDIDSLMKDAGYNDKNLTILKYAATLSLMGREDIAENLLSKSAMDFSNVDEYLKTASSYYKIEIEKTASNIFKTIGGSLAGDMVMDNVKKGSLLSAVPGYLADALIFAGVGKGLKHLGNKNINQMKGDVVNHV